MTRLLIVTQAVDSDDPILGFFHRWIEEFSKHFEGVEIICLKEGKHNLPPNVRVHSLGKERGRRFRIAYAFNFLRLVWVLRNQYDTVFVHMNPEYVILAGPLWRLFGKRVGLWYNHERGGARLSLAASLVDIVWHVSPYAASARFSHSRRMPAGIDTEIFSSKGGKRERRSVYYQGRIAPSKNVATLIEALSYCPEARLTLVGPEDPAYMARLRRDFTRLVSSGRVIFAGPKRNDETPALYGAHGLSVNLSAPGHYDKSVLESMACETPVIVSSPAFSGMVPERWRVSEKDARALGEKMTEMMNLPEAQYEELGKVLRKAVISSQGLAALTNRLVRDLALPQAVI